MKKILMITAAFMTIQSLPVFAEDHKGGHKEHKMMHDRQIKGDTNGDGMISQEEFLARAQERFNSADANGNGLIDREEAKAAYQNKRAEKTEKRAEMKEKMQEKRNEMKNKMQEDMAADMPEEKLGEE